MVNAADVVGFDVYPIFGYGTPGWLNHPASGVKQLIQIAESRPVFIWIESGKGSKWMPYEKQPDVLPHHTHYQVWSALINGATAIGYFTVCGGGIQISEIYCQKCETTIRCKFELCKFCKLTEHQKYFIEVFIKNRGNIKEIEKELGISYPTVRNKLDEVVTALGYHVDQQKNHVNRKEILERLSRGEISKDDAIKLLSE